MQNANELNVNATRRHALRAAESTGNTGRLPDIEQFAETLSAEPDSPFPYLEVLLRQAKESPFLVVGIMISVAAIIVAAVMSLTVGFGIFLFNMNGTMHEIKAQQATTLVEIAKTSADVDNMGNTMRAYEAANGKRGEFMVGLMTKDNQRAMNEYDQAHPLPKMPEKKRNDFNATH